MERGGMSDNWRKGQKAFNDLYLEYPEIANLIRGTEYDPFYNDEKLEAFYVRVAELKESIEWSDFAMYHAFKDDE